MSDDYTPTVEQLRNAWHAVCSDGNNRHDYAENAAEVDRMIESVRTEERERIARNIEAKTPDGRKSAAFCAGGAPAATRTRVVTTVTELDALPVKSIFQCRNGSAWGKHYDGTWSPVGLHIGRSSELMGPWLPGRVLYDPEE